MLVLFSLWNLITNCKAGKANGFYFYEFYHTCSAKGHFVGGYNCRKKFHSDFKASFSTSSE